MRSEHLQGQHHGVDGACLHQALNLAHIVGVQRIKHRLQAR